MALQKQWLRPVDWLEGDYPRTDAHPWTNKYRLRIFDFYTATDDLTLWTVLDLGNLKDCDGKIVKRTVINEIHYRVWGISLQMFWDRTPTAVAGSGQIGYPFLTCGGLALTVEGATKGPLVDPGVGDGSDGTGNWLITTEGSADGDFFDVTIDFTVKSNIKPGAIVTDDSG